MTETSLSIPRYLLSPPSPLAPLLIVLLPVVPVMLPGGALFRRFELYQKGGVWSSFRWQTLAVDSDLANDSLPRKTKVDVLVRHLIILCW